MFKKIFLLFITAIMALSACGTFKMGLQERRMPAAQPPPAPSATASSPGGISMSFAGTSFILPDGLASSATAETTTNVELPFTNSSNEDMPEHTRITFINYPLPGKHSAYIAIFPASEYSDYAELAAAEVYLLQTILDSQTLSDYDDMIPQSLRIDGRPARSKIILLQHGRGMRYLTQITTGPEPINNQEVIYWFQGLTADEKYYISAAFPVRASFLQADNDPGAIPPPGGIRFPKGMTSDESVVSQYYDQVYEIMNNAAPDSFIPRLETLDALLQSLNVVAP